MIMLGSYSYLGLIGHPEIDTAAAAAIRNYGTGTHGVRLLAGTLPLHAELENRISEIKGSDAAMVLSSGYLTNLTAITSLVGRGDFVVSDKLNHASIVDGCRLSGARMVCVRHNDMEDLDAKLGEIATDGNVLVVADAVFSMDGDIYDLPRASEICRRHGALLMLDEAHSIGAIGATGRGIEEHYGLGPDSFDIKMGTLSKAIPSAGGYLAADADIIDMMRHNGRGFVYSASLPPAQTAAALKALDIMEKESWRVRALHRNTTRFREQLQTQGLDTLGSRTAIVPVVCGSDNDAYLAARSCHQKGIFVQAIPTPVVPAGTARLRCCVTALHTPDDLEFCAETIGQVCRELGITSPSLQEASGR
jgi:glycine C-acetyltransferase